MSRRRDQNDDEPGQDSFLDIVANLVGIMIILVIVVGVRAKGAMEKTPLLSIQAAEKPDVESAAKAVAGVKHELQQLTSRAGQFQTELQYRALERNKLLTRVAALESELKRKRETLSDQQQAMLDKQSAISEAQNELEKLASTANALKQDEQRVEVIQHLPTPMAKTVYGHEVHFRLTDHKLTYVPWDELIERLTKDARQNAWKLRDAPTVTETLGPVRNFMMTYTLERKRYAVETQVGAAVQSQIQLQAFQIHPVEENGEPVGVALNPDSMFNSILAAYEPARTTVTFWVYPDSFDDYRQLQKSLFDRGFLSAARPMPADAPIGGSPKGTRAAAQ